MHGFSNFYFQTLESFFEGNSTDKNRFPANVVVLFATREYAKSVIESAVELQV